MIVIFHDMFLTIMEDYVDDILAKYITRESHLEVLAIFFYRLENIK